MKLDQPERLPGQVYQERERNCLQIGLPPPYPPSIRLILEWTGRHVSSALPTLYHTLLSGRPPTAPEKKQAEQTDVNLWHQL